MTQVDYGWLACIDCGIASRIPTRGVISERETRCLRCGGALAPPHEDDDPVAPVRRAWEALLTGDVDACVDEFQPDARWDSVTRRIVDAGPWKTRFGREAIRSWITEVLGRCDVFADELQPRVNGVLAIGGWTLKQRPTATFAAAWVFQLREGKIASGDGHLNLETATASAGRLLDSGLPDVRRGRIGRPAMTRRSAT